MIITNNINREINTNFNSPLGVGGSFVIADDLTGAAEIAGVCLRYGLKVSFGIDAVPQDETDVKIIATDSRSATEVEAYNIHRKLAIEIYKNPDSFVFKKCDSVLRGFVLTELSAVLSVKNFDQILIQPANPATGRYIKNGIYYIDNLKIKDTGFSTDPDFPAIDSMIQNILFLRSKKNNCIREIHTGKINEISGSGVFVPDCSTVEELRNCSKLSVRKLLLCGSAAFFEQILIENAFELKNDSYIKPVVSSGFLFVCGSTHPESKKFILKMKNSGCPVSYFPKKLLQKNIDEAEIDIWIKELIRIYSLNNRLLISLSKDNISFPESSNILKKRTALIVNKLLSKVNINDLFIEGGATAFEIIKNLKQKTFNPEQELAPGVVRMGLKREDNLHITFKPGSYIWPENIVEL